MVHECNQIYKMSQKVQKSQIHAPHQPMSNQIPHHDPLQGHTHGKGNDRWNGENHQRPAFKGGDHLRDNYGDNTMRPDHALNEKQTKSHHKDRK